MMLCAFVEQSLACVKLAVLRAITMLRGSVEQGNAANLESGRCPVLLVLRQQSGCLSVVACCWCLPFAGQCVAALVSL